MYANQYPTVRIYFIYSVYFLALKKTTKMAKRPPPRIGTRPYNGSRSVILLVLNVWCLLESSAYNVRSRILYVFAFTATVVLMISFGNASYSSTAFHILYFLHTLYFKNFLCSVSAPFITSSFLGSSVA